MANRRIMVQIIPRMSFWLCPTISARFSRWGEPRETEEGEEKERGEEDKPSAEIPMRRTLVLMNASALLMFSIWWMRMRGFLLYEKDVSPMISRRCRSLMPLSRSVVRSSTDSPRFLRCELTHFVKVCAVSRRRRGRGKGQSGRAAFGRGGRGREGRWFSGRTLFWMSSHVFSSSAMACCGACGLAVEGRRRKVALIRQSKQKNQDNSNTNTSINPSLSPLSSHCPFIILPIFSFHRRSRCCWLQSAFSPSRSSLCTLSDSSTGKRAQRPCCSLAPSAPFFSSLASRTGTRNTFSSTTASASPSLSLIISPELAPQTQGNKRMTDPKHKVPVQALNGRRDHAAVRGEKRETSVASGIERCKIQWCLRAA